MRSFDYVIVGGGSAGAVLADRLSEDGRSTVLLLEAGGPDNHLSLRIPLGFVFALGNPALAWHHRTAPDLDGRVFGLPRGKVLGGSSSLNGLVWVRGQPEDYDHWRQLGCSGWGYDDVLPYFRKIERYSEGASEQRGGDGPLAITKGKRLNGASDLFIAAAVAAGLPLNDDYNDGDQEGVSYFQTTTRAGLRTSSATAYLRRAMKRRNLTVETGATVETVTIESGRATGVRYRREGAAQEAQADGEVILSAGAISSPHILMLSGIGDPEQLARLGILVRAASPRVGANLRDHYNTTVVAAMKKEGLTINERRRLPYAAIEALKYGFLRGGMFATSPAQVVAFARSGPQATTPDIELMMVPAVTGDKPGRLPPTPGLGCGVQPIRAESVGTVSLDPADPAAMPVIRPNYLSAPADQQVTVAGLRLIRRIFAQEPLASHITGEILPGVDVESDDELLAFARAKGTTAHHLVGTCAMGPDPAAVVDPTLKVNGVAGLRVADASIMPMIVSGNTNAATVMIAERASAFILSDRR